MISQFCKPDLILLRYLWYRPSGKRHLLNRHSIRCRLTGYYCPFLGLPSLIDRLIVLLQLIYVTSGLFDIGWLFFGLEQFKLTVARNTLIKISTVVLMFVFVHKPSDLWKYTLIMSAGTLFSQAYLWLYVKKYVSFEKCSVKEITSNIKPVLILFIPVLAYSIYKVMDKIMLGNMSSYDQVGFYNNAEKIINIPMGIITALGTVMLPRMSNIVANGDKKRVDDYIRISAKLVTLLSSAIAFGLMGVSSVLAPMTSLNSFSISLRMINTT